MVQQIAAVLIVLALLAGTLYLLRRKGIAQIRPIRVKRGGERAQMRVIEQIALGPQHALHLVQVTDRIMVIGTSPSGCNCLFNFHSSGQGAAGGAQV